MLTIFTPTYNRRHLLSRLYASINQQNSKDFEWIIIDDGSTDDTKHYVQSLISSADFKIIYRWQKNSGKHAAHNLATSIASGELFLCVDSDDYLAHANVTKEILDTWNLCKDNFSCAGILSLKGLQNGHILGNNLPSNINYCSSFDLTHFHQSKGERNLIYRTKYLKHCLYPIYSGETFCPDSYISDAISKTYTFYLRPYIDVLCEYQPDGLSHTFSTLMKNNPCGFCVSNMQMIDMLKTTKTRIFTILRFWAFYFLASTKAIQYTGFKHKRLVKILKIPGYLYSLYYRMRL